MSEEIKKPGTEISDAALSGVSGGYSQEDFEAAKRMCQQCQRELPDACFASGPKDLAPIINSVEYYTFCPYFDGARG